MIKKKASGKRRGKRNSKTKSKRDKSIWKCREGRGSESFDEMMCLFKLYSGRKPWREGGMMKENEKSRRGEERGSQ